MYLRPLLASFTSAITLAIAPSAQDPVVTSVQPTSAEHPGAVAIDGANFDAASLVSFDGVPAAVQSFTPTQLVVVPAVGAPGFPDVTVTNAVGSTTADEAGTLWPALSVSENGLGGALTLILSNGEAGLVVYAYSLGLLGAPVAIDPGIHYGVLLNPAGAFGVLGNFPVGGGGEHTVALPIGSAPSTLGLTVHLQAFATQGLPAHDAAFSNAVSAQIGGSLAPRGLWYPTDPMDLVLGEPAAPNTPLVSGWVDTWQIAPPLPAGLALDPVDGTIAGTPAALSPETTYTVTAANPAGATTTQLALGVQPDALHIEHATHGFGQLLPHQTIDPATLAPIDLDSLALLDAQLAQGALLIPHAPWPTGALLPNGSSGNHFVAVRFSDVIDVDSVLDPSLAGAAFSHLTGAITVTSVDPVTGVTTPLAGQPFVDGFTYGATVSGGAYALEPWVAYDPLDLDGDGILAEPQSIAGAFPGVGFPGSEGTSFVGTGDLFGADTFVFVLDSDSALATHETAPSGATIRVEISEAVRSASGAPLADRGSIALTVGVDTIAPAVQLAGGFPQITPGNGDVNVDPETEITVRFTESIQPLSLSSNWLSDPAGLSFGIDLAYGGLAQSIDMPFTLRVTSPFDLSTVVIDPAEPFPGSGLALGSCADYGVVDLSVNAFGVQDLTSNSLTTAVMSGFTTAPGQGIVNAPIAPDAIYVGRASSLSIVDLNGFGGGTGTPAYDVLCPVGPDRTDYPNNPNVSLQGALMMPPLAPGSCTLDGGSDGVFSLTKDTSLDDRMLRGAVLSIDDMALGHSLDRIWNNGVPFGCAAGGGSLCASSALQLFQADFNGAHTLVPVGGGAAQLTVIGGGNPISWAPHPNPPTLALPPLCSAPSILGTEPTSVDTTVLNLLAPGASPLGDPALCFPPSSLLSPEQNAFFNGPSPSPQTTPANCPTYAFRQQIGHFLYAVDRAAGELIVLNSNRMTVLERIALPDPTRLAMSPNLDLLAVTNAGPGVVSFVDVDPLSSTFHQVVKTTAVGANAQGVAWDGGNEDIFVCNEGSGTVSVISAFDLEVRKTLTGFLGEPFDVVTTPRQSGFGLNRGVYYAWILNRDGTLTLFESGPSGAGGIGYDDCIGVAPFALANPRAIQPDPRELSGAVWIAHARPLDPATGLPTGVGGPAGPALTRVSLVAAVLGVQPIVPGSLPDLRDLDLAIDASLDNTVLTGMPFDIAFDDQRNLGSAPNLASPFGAGAALAMNGKTLVKSLPGVGVRNASEPRLMFAAVPSSTEGPGVVDAIDLSTLTRFDTNAATAGVQSIPAPGASVLMHYFRQ